MEKKFSTNALEICSRCLSYEVNGWVSDKWKEMDEETKKQIAEELKSIKLKSGECIVCKNNLISDGTPERILRILEENKTPNRIKKEFIELFFVNREIESEKNEKEESNREDISV